MKNRIFILLFCQFLAACSLFPPGRLQPVLTTRAVPTAAVTATGFESTPNSLEVSQTPDPTDDVIVYPTATYLVPTLVQQTQYELVDWSPKLANQLITVLRAYPDNLGFPERGYHDSGYYSASRYALFAEQEAQMQFPSSSFMEDWVWDAAHRMALIGSPDVIDTYAILIDQALNAGRIEVQHLETWFDDHENRLQLKVTILPPLAYLQSNYLIEISDLYQSTGVYLWLVKDSTRFAVYPLPASDHGGYGDFGFASAEGIQAEWQDVTGDSVAEIITTHAFFPGSGDALVTNFDIFDITRTPPHKVEFNPPIPGMRHRTWSVTPGDDHKTLMRFDFVFDRILCPFTIGKEYQWDGNAFQLIRHHYPDNLQVIEQAGEECIDQLVFSLLLDLQHGDIETVNVLDSMLDGWPYSNDPWLPGEDDSPDTRDKARFIAGLYLAVNGQVDASRREMRLIISDPVVPTSNWVGLAGEFLDVFHNINDLPDACIALKVCGDFLDLDQIMGTFSASNPHAIVDFINQAGVNLLKSGTFDANNDGQLDSWIVVNNDAGTPITRLFIQDEFGVQSFSPGTLSTTSPLALHTQQPFNGYPVFAIQSDGGREVFIFDQDPFSTEIQLSRLCDHLDTELNDLQNGLMAGVPPAEISEGLSRIEQSLDAACVGPYPRVGYIRPRLHYLLGLAYEMAGDELDAVNNYLEVWKSYPGSPYAIMSRAKLVPVSS